jgi:very-short-patch-repair endonuclease
LIDLGSRLSRGRLERAISEADRLDLVDPEALRQSLEGVRRPGAAVLRKTLDRRTFVLTESALEHRFLLIARKAGLAGLLAQQIVNGLRVDFYSPELGLVIEVDGLRYHRTAAQQARDRRRDQVHLAAGMTPVRFTHAQVAFESAEVEQVLTRIICRLRSRT